MQKRLSLTRARCVPAPLRAAILAALAVFIIGGLAACATEGSLEGPADAPPYESVAPGTVESMGHPKMGLVTAAHEALRPGDDEIVVYYLRNDADYGPWGFWHWAIPGGDGAAAWERTKELGVIEGVGYLRFKKDGSTFSVPTIGADGLFGIIARKDGAWEKDGDADRIIDAKASNAWAIFQNDSKTYPYGPYVPAIDGARLSAKKEIVLELSGRYGLDLEAGPSGFSLAYADGSRGIAILDAVNNADPDTRQNNYARRVRLLLAEEAPLDAALLVSHPAFLAPARVESAALAAALADDIVPPESYRLGAIYDPRAKSAEFRLWSPFAGAVTLRLYRQSLGRKPDYSLPMAKDAASGVWSARFDAADPEGFFYEYALNFGSRESIALDPYALSMDAFTGSGPGRGAVVDMAKAQPVGGWEGYTDIVLAKREDAIIYELSVRDFTIGTDAGTKARPGSYLAFIEKIPYLKELGVTHVQLMPVLNFYYTDELDTAFEANARASDNNYNWGYDPHGYFAPEGWFASDASDPYARMIELKTLIKELHRAGLGVLLDVVYNHTANTAILDDIVPGYYYRRDAKGALSNNSGVGNDLATERAMASRLIRDSIYHWVDEYKVDGFRFDLMGLIDADTLLKAREAASRLPGKDDLLFQGEGWKMYRGPALTVLDQNYMAKTDFVSVFNDEFRDILKAGGLNDRAKGFVTGRPINTAMIFNNLAGRPMLNYRADDPGDSMNYVSAHDNLSLADNIAFNAGLSAAYPAERAEIAARSKLAYFFVLTGQPLAFMHGGDERGRSKPRLKSSSEITGDYVHNSYDASDDINRFPWAIAPEYEGLAAWVKGLIAIRKAEPGLRLGDAALVEKAMKQLPHDDQLSMAWTLSHGGSTLIMLVNANFDAAVDIQTGLDLSGARVLADDDEAAPGGVARPSGFSISGSTVTVAPLSAVLLKVSAP